MLSSVTVVKLFGGLRRIFEVYLKSIGFENGFEELPFDKDLESDFEIAFDVVCWIAFNHRRFDAPVRKGKARVCCSWAYQGTNL